jgi:plastocyanin
MRRIFLAILLAASTAGILTASGAQDRGVRVDDNIFDPSFVVVEAGTTVVWQNVGSQGHSVTPQRGSSEPRDSNPECATLTFIACMQPGERYSWTFERPGTYTYYCRVHGDSTAAPDPNAAPDEQPCGMCGIVKVAAGPAASPTPTAIASPTPKKTATPRAGPSVTPSAAPTLSPSGTVAASPTGRERARGEGAGDGARVGLAVLGAVVLGGAGYLVWRSFIADR